MAYSVKSAAVLVVAALFISACDNKGTERSTSSGVFFAPVAPQDGEQRVSTVVSRVDIAKAAKATVVPNLFGELVVNLPPANDVEGDILNTFVLGRIGEEEFVLYEQRSTTLLQIDLNANPVLDLRSLKTYLFRPEILTTLTSAAASFEISTVLNVFDDVIFAYENASLQLVVVRKDDDGNPLTEDGLKLEILATRREIENQTRRTSLRFLSAVLLPPRESPPPGERIAEILLVPNGVASFGVKKDLQLFVVREDSNGEISGTFSVFSTTAPDFDLVPHDPFNPPNSDPVFGFVSFDHILYATDSSGLDIFEFVPTNIPSTNCFLIFDKVTGNFVAVHFNRNPVTGEIDTIATPTLFTESGQVAQALLQIGVNKPDVDFQRAVPHGSKPLILTFEEESNNMLALDFSRDFMHGISRVSLFAPSTNIRQRRDTLGGVDPELAGLEPAFSFATGADLRNESLLIFDRSTDELLTLHYNTGTYVVLAKQADIAEATGIFGISDLTFFEPLTDQEVLSFDTEGSTLFKIRVRYAAFPIVFPTNF